MKNNFIAKHMNTFNKPSVHSNLKKDYELNDEEHINEGIQELEENIENESDNEE